jgi:hypothetical protein
VTGFVGLDTDKVRRLAKNLDGVADKVPALHTSLAGILNDAQGALDPGEHATTNPDLQRVQWSTGTGIGAAVPNSVLSYGAYLPSSLQTDLPDLARTMRKRCDLAEKAVRKHGYGQGITALDAFNGVTPQPPPKPKKKGWFSKYVSGPLKHGVQDVGDFVSSVFTWRNVLDAGSMALGLVMMSLASGAEVGGVALDATGGGAILGVPINVAAAGLFTAGASLALAGGGDMLYRAADGETGGGGGEEGGGGGNDDALGSKSDPLPISAEDQSLYDADTEELNGLSRSKQIAKVAKGIDEDGVFRKPEAKILRGGKHGIDWTEGPQRANKLEGGAYRPQGRFGSVADVKFATRMAMKLKPKQIGFFRLPDGSSSIQYVRNPDDPRNPFIVKANAVFVRVGPDGTIHAYPYRMIGETLP